MEWGAVADAGHEPVLTSPEEGSVQHAAWTLGGSRCDARPSAHFVAEPADRYPQRRGAWVDEPVVAE